MVVYSKYQILKRPGYVYAVKSNGIFGSYFSEEFKFCYLYSVSKALFVSI